MPRHGSRRSPLKHSVSLALFLTLAAFGVRAEAPQRVDDGIPASLTGEAGDPARGRAVVLNRAVSACLLCHSGPFPEAPFQGTLAPSLAGAGERLSPAQIRLRLVDPTVLDPNSLMPSYYRTEGLNRVGPNWRGKTVLTAAQIEDVVAYLVSLK
jgi:sulfur-oxidizing protein SoxX